MKGLELATQEVALAAATVPKHLAWQPVPENQVLLATTQKSRPAGTKG